ncbi:mediator of RNA polymerase II transcription subunit 1-domain-containing protein [Gigaspora margarita]|uniref:Mediator of RNA polymerase II transcription subunit 1 n=2 Tax=Gigaspora margarita TaxID=4874 RepID=A0A8H3X635_GIGMA|nr:mediator of RNA polymerase II transcription subunit 1-domain-containing protein [Gigaspora margarita]
MTEADPKRIHILLRELQNLIKNAQEQWGITLTGQGSINDKLKAFAPVANAVHPLGPVNIVGLSTEFSQKIALIRSTLSNFRNTTVHDISQLNLSIGSDSLLKRYQFALLEESNNLNTVSEVRENIKICKELALDICQNSQDTFKFVIQQTSIFCKQLGLKVWEVEQSHGSTLTLSISGSIIVMDIKFDETAHKIVQVTITYTHKPEDDDRIDNLLTLQLSNFRYFKLFKKNLQALATLDTLSKIYSANCFHCIRCISNDVKSIYEKEFSALAGDIQKILTDGHGIPLFHVERVGPSIAYWAPKFRIHETDWNNVKDIIAKGDSCESLGLFYQLWIMMEESRSRNTFLPIERNHYLIEENDDEYELLQSYDFMPQDLTFPLLPTPLKFLQQPKDDSQTSANIQFVLWLFPPVYVTDTVAKEIEDLAGFFGSRIMTDDPKSLSLEQLLISDIVPPAKMTRGSTMDVSWEKKFEDSPYTQIYTLDIKHTNAKKIERIPFIYPFQIFSFIEILRQQLVYNALFQSCFNSSTYCPQRISSQSSAANFEGLIRILYLPIPTSFILTLF